MRILLASLALLTFGCVKETAPPLAPATETAATNEATDEIVSETNESGGQPTIEDMRAQSLAEVDQKACKEAGGIVRQEGMLGLYRCVKPYKDAGAACRSDADCEGKCLASAEMSSGAEAVGACQANDSPFGCYAEIEDGKVTAAICVD